MPTLRQYQREARVAVNCDWTEVDSTLVFLFTGAGKTVLFASLANDWRKGRTLISVPDINLVDQTAKKIRQWTGERPAIEQGDRWSNEDSHYRSQFVVACVKSLLSGERYKRFNDIGLLVIDECDEGMTQARQRMQDWFALHGAKVLGVTASVRADGLGMNNCFKRCSYKYDISQAIHDGWLVPAKVCCLQLESLDLSEVKLTSKGDFKQEELNELLETDKVVFEIASAVAQESGNLKTAVYCGRVKGAKAIAEYLCDHYGLDAAWVCGDERLCSKSRFKEVCESFTEDKDGVQIVVNVGKLSRGWDFPGLEHIVNARPTMSLPLLTQIFGRGTRPLKGVVDFEGSTAETRKAAIANSAKPHFKFTDLRDSVMRHKLVSPVDVLAGSMGLPLVDLAKRRMPFGVSFDPNDLFGEAAREAEEIEEARQRVMRARVDSKAQFRRVEVDPFDGVVTGDEVKERRGGRRTTFVPATEKQLNFLKWKGINTAGRLVSKKQAMRMISQLQRGATCEEIWRTNRLQKIEPDKPRPDVPVDDVNRMLMEM